MNTAAQADANLLRELFAREEAVPWADLAPAGLSIPAARERVRELVACGYPIEDVPPGRVRLVRPVPDVWCAEEIAGRVNPLESSPAAVTPPWQVMLFRETGSTNDVAWREGVNGHRGQLLVLAERQKAGRGRQSRAWHSAPAAGLYGSLCVRPGCEPRDLSRLTILTALAVADAVEKVAGRAVELKWPNDLLMGGRKLGGILLEAQSSLERVAFVIIGVGLNLQHVEADFPPEVRALATSIREQTGRRVRRADVAVEWLRAWERRLAMPFADAREEWAARCITLGRLIAVQTSTGLREGQAAGVDEDGALLLRTPHGTIETIRAGDLLSPPRPR